MESRLDAVAEEYARCYYYRPCGRGRKACIHAQTPGQANGELSANPTKFNTTRNLEDPPAQDMATAYCIVHDKWRACCEHARKSKFKLVQSPIHITTHLDCLWKRHYCDFFDGSMITPSSIKKNPSLSPFPCEPERCWGHRVHGPEEKSCWLKKRSHLGDHVAPKVCMNLKPASWNDTEIRWELPQSLSRGLPQFPQTPATLL